MAPMSPLAPRSPKISPRKVWESLADGKSTSRAGLHANAGNWLRHNSPAGDPAKSRKQAGSLAAADLHPAWVFVDYLPFALFSFFNSLSNYRFSAPENLIRALPEC